MEFTFHIFFYFVSLPFRPKKERNIYSKLEEHVEAKTEKMINCKSCDKNKETGKCAKSKPSIECAFEDIPENVCDSVEISFEDIKDETYDSPYSDTFSDIPTNTFEDIEVAIKETWFYSINIVIHNT